MTQTIWTTRHVYYTPAYCHRCGCVVFVRHESGSQTGFVEDHCPLCGGTDIERVSPRLANLLQRQSRDGGRR